MKIVILKHVLFLHFTLFREENIIWALLDDNSNLQVLIALQFGHELKILDFMCNLPFFLSG